MTRINKLDNINCAKFIFEQIYNQQACKKKINIALSGGKTPLPILKLLSNYDLDWNNIKFFLVDERDYNTKNDSNYFNLKRSFFDKIKSENFEFFDKKIGLKKSLKKYKSLIKENVDVKNGIPSFDFIFLGMGEDGHIASIFPETAAEKEFDDILILNKVPKLKTNRLTFTFPLILNSKHIILLVSGKNKEQLLKNDNQQKPIHFFLDNAYNYDLISLK